MWTSLGLFFQSPLGKLVAKILGGVALAVALFFVVKHYSHKFLEGVRDEVRQEYVIRDLKAAVVQAEKDRKFAQEQAFKAQQQEQELRDDLSAAVSKIKGSSTIIHDRVASGEFQNGQISPLLSATLDQIDALEEQRKKEEAAQK